MQNETNLGNNLIQLYAELNCNLKETKELIERAVFYSNTNGANNGYLLAQKLIEDYTQLLQSFYLEDYATNAITEELKED